MKRTSLLAVVCLVGLGVLAARADFLGKSAADWQKELNDPDAKVRRSAAFALGRLGADARPAMRDLVRRLRDTEGGVRAMAASALGDIVKALNGDALDVWKEASGMLRQVLENDEDAHVRRAAAYALGTFGPRGAPAAPYLRTALSDDSAMVRQNAAWALGQIGEGAGEAVGELCERLKDKDVLVRRDAAGALGSMGKDGTESVAPLIRLVESEPDEVVKKTALDSLAHLAGPKHKKFASGLEPLLEDKDAEVSLGAATVLARIGGSESARALPVLRKALKDPDPEVRQKSAASLSNLGPAAAPAKFDLADALSDDKNPAIVRRYAALAIAHIGKEAKPVVPALVKALQANEPQDIRRYAAEALAQMEYPANEKALPVILKTIANDADPLVRQKCVWSLFQLGSPRDPKPFLDCGADRVLTKLLDEQGFDLSRYDAARKLAQVLGADAPDKAADVLLTMLQSKGLNVYNGTDATVTGANTEAAAGKVNVKENLGGDARYMAVEALGWMKGKARARKDVMEALRKAAEDKDAKLRKTAKEALDNLAN
ncbi:MAG TPA: HEAT repeat domain-containing protein [Gemmataceae bacterium]|jgi:HEAT repeat protein